MKAILIATTFAVLFLVFGGTVANAQYVVSSANRAKLNGPTVTFNGKQTLLWNSSSSSLPQARNYFLAFPLVGGVQVGETSPSGTTGECVALVKALVPAVGATSTWRRGEAVVGGNLPVGTAVATFKQVNGQWRYDGHAAVFRGYASGGKIKLWSQNWPYNYRCIIQHEISATNGSLSDPHRYYAIKH